MFLLEPDVPGFALIESGEDYVNVSWVPTEDGRPMRNPGSEFYVVYRPHGKFLGLPPEGSTGSS